MTRRKLDLKVLDAVVAEAQRLNDRGCQKSGEWDLGQACRHSAMAIRETVDGFSFKPPGIMRLLVSLMGMKKKLFATRTIKAGLKAPASMVPSPGLDEPKEIENLRQAVEHFKSNEGRYLPHPIFGVLPNDEWHQFHTIHTMHHLSFFNTEIGIGKRRSDEGVVAADQGGIGRIR